MPNETNARHAVTIADDDARLMATCAALEAVEAGIAALYRHAPAGGDDCPVEAQADALFVARAKLLNAASGIRGTSLDAIRARARVYRAHTAGSMENVERLAVSECIHERIMAQILRDLLAEGV